MKKTLTPGQKKVKTLTGRGSKVKITKKNLSPPKAKAIVKKWRTGPGKEIVQAWTSKSLAPVPIMNQVFFLEGRHEGKKREFKVKPIPTPTGACIGSFRIWEIIDGQLSPSGFSLSLPTFWDACRIAEELSSKKQILTGTFQFKEKTMTVSKKSKKQQEEKKASKVTKKVPTAKEVAAKRKAEDKQIVKSLLEAGNEAAAKKAADEKKSKVPSTVVIVLGTDDRWLFGPITDEAKLKKMKGKYDTAAEADEAAAKAHHDIIINNGPAPASKSKTNWASPAVASSTKGGEKAAEIANGVSLKKVCADADIDPKLARRILRAQGKKPGGRWEWSKDDAPKIVTLLKEGAAALAKKAAK